MSYVQYLLLECSCLMFTIYYWSVHVLCLLFTTRVFMSYVYYLLLECSCLMFTIYYWGVTFSPDKVYSSILNFRLLSSVEELMLLIKYQSGFRKSQSCEDHIFTSYWIINIIKSQGRPSLLPF